MKQIFSLLVLLSILSCGDATQSNNSATKTEQEQNKQQELHEHIPVAEKGITVVNENGWTQSQMDFHTGYCIDMMASLENFQPVVFCECFLGKIQYYYEPRFFKEAYEDQTKWNGDCYLEATL